MLLRDIRLILMGKTHIPDRIMKKENALPSLIGEKKLFVNSQDSPHEQVSLRTNVQNNAWKNREVVVKIGSSDSLKSKIKAEDWNSCHLIVKDYRLQHFINEILMSEVTDLDSVNRKSSGFLGLQVHVGPPMKVEYRNIKLKEL